MANGEPSISSLCDFFFLYVFLWEHLYSIREASGKENVALGKCNKRVLGTKKNCKQEASGPKCVVVSHEGGSPHVLNCPTFLLYFK